MPANASFRAPDFRAIFAELPGLYLLLTNDLHIIAASNAYLRATATTKAIFGRSVFDVFPDSEANAHAGARALARSFERVLERKATDSMALQRYDLVLEDGSSDVRYWSPINIPVFDDAGRLRWLLHRVSDVTPAIAGPANDSRVAELQAELYGSAQRLSLSNEALRASETTLRLALEAGRMAVWRYRSDDTRLTTTPQLNRLIGFRLERLVTLREVRRGFQDGPAAVLRAAMSAWHAGQRVFEHQFRYRRHDDGDVVWLRVRGEIIPDAKGRPGEALGVAEDVTESVAARDYQKMLIDELNHRVKNNLALMQSLAIRTFRNRGCDGALHEYIERLVGLASTHELLTRSNWQSASLIDVIDGSIHGIGVGSERYRLEGPDVRLPPQLAVSLSLALHELATNAVKYGAYSGPNGVVTVSWTYDAPGRQIALEWRETGGPTIRPPERHGFETQLLARTLGGAATIDYPPEGVVCRMQLQIA